MSSVPRYRCIPNALLCVSRILFSVAIPKTFNKQNSRCIIMSREYLNVYHDPLPWGYMGVSNATFRQQDASFLPLLRLALHFPYCCIIVVAKGISPEIMDKLSLTKFLHRTPPSKEHRPPKHAARQRTPR